MFDKTDKEELMESIKEEIKPPIHYHGDIIRGLFIAATAIMIVSLPFFYKIISMPLPVSLLAIVILATAAGLTTYNQKWTLYIDCLIAIVGFCVFELNAVRMYVDNGKIMLALINQVLALIFLIALYYSVRSLRWSIIHHLP